MLLYEDIFLYGQEYHQKKNNHSMMAAAVKTSCLSLN